MSDRFKIVQPREVLEFYRDLTEHAGFELETAGVLQGGRKFWALAHTGQSERIKGNDESRGYVLLASSCDGSFATTAQFTHIRVVCNNTLSAALNDQTGAVKVPHRSVFDPLQVKQELGISVSIWGGFMDQLKALADRKVKNAEVERFFTKAFTVTRYDPKPVQVVHEKAANHALSLFNGNGMGSSLASSKGTAYGLLNAVTEYIDHYRPARSDDNRLNAAWFGEGAAIKGREPNNSKTHNPQYKTHIYQLLSCQHQLP